MGANTFIGWTGSTLNPWTWRCKPVAPECFNCFSETLTDRWQGPGAFRSGPPVLKPERLLLPWTDPGIRATAEIFLTSMMDPFYPSIPLDDQVMVWAMMAADRAHVYQVLTKRPDIMLKLLTRPDFPDLVREAMAKYVALLTPPSGRLSPLRRGWIDGITAAIADFRWPLPNVVLGVSAGSQESAEKFIPPLLLAPAARRFLSAEPLIAPLNLDLPRCDAHDRMEIVTDIRGQEWCEPCSADGFTGELSFGHWLDPLNDGLSWVIVGGESGKVYAPDPFNPPTDENGETGGYARPMQLDWARRIVRDCTDTDVPVFVKQLGTVQAHVMGLADRKGADTSEWPPDVADLVVRGSLDPTG